MACYLFKAISIHFNAFILILLGVNLTLQLNEVNVAYQKGVIFCGYEYMGDFPTDGNRHEVVETADVEGCGVHVYFIVSLSTAYFMQHVILYPGDITVGENVDHPLDYYIVEVNDPLQDDCGILPKSLDIVQNFSKGLRINCKKLEFTFQEVTFLLKVPVPFSFAEVEIYTFGSSSPANASYIHRGCFTDFTFKSQFRFSSILSCRTNCMDNGTTIMAVSQPLGKCLCGFMFDDDYEVSLATCTERCLGVDKMCGGSNSYSIYIMRYQLPYHMGCTHAPAPNTNVTRITNMTIGKCLKQCQDFPGVWIKSDSCICHTEFLAKVEELDCDYRCEGDRENVCGGLHHASTYTTCKDRYNLYLPCMLLLNCLNDDYDEFGVCLRGCQAGFSGQNCIERVSDSPTRFTASRKPTTTTTTTTRNPPVTISRKTRRTRKKGRSGKLSSIFILQIMTFLLVMNVV